ncbi:hypothetical protein PMIN01_00214 [Paraphaeosphaeria minitans]|uniref:Uncharacterized protein n=1 Tax=Paraphaeosphaeria minitans TaxID=565426 RepID=A0A9P6GUB6_9PLEO|nr:hypothetical protein PMIN01_00214 [Paraphaeosphaeria minitans]
MSRFSLDSLPMYSPPAFTPQAYTAEEYAYLIPAELPVDREPCELSTHTDPGLGRQMSRHEDAECYATPVDAVARQRHHLLDRVTSAPTNIGRVQNTSPAISRALTPINTSVDMTRTSPVRMSAHYVSPSKDHGHDYRAIDVACTTLLSPPTTLSPSSFQMSPSTSTSPRGSVISGTADYRTAKPATHGMQNANGPLQRTFGLQNSQYNMYSRDQYPYNQSLSPASPITRHNDNFMIADHAPFATAATHLHHHSSHNPEVSEQLPYLSNAQQNLSAYHRVQYGLSDLTSQLYRFAQRRLSASEQYINGLPSHVSSGPYYDGYQSQHTTYNTSSSLDEALPAYDASGSVPLRVEEPPRPQYRQSKVKRTAATAARAIVNLLPLACLHCGELFTGKYQKANCLRHINLFHVDVDLSAAGIDDGKTCRACFQRFRRPAKHEWKQHRIEDCRPNKRRIEKRGREMRIYMPPMPEESGSN